MDKKVIVVGLSTEYHSMSVESALSDGRERLYSTNMGACFITRSLVKIFDADYVDFNLAQPEKLRNKYQVCLVSVASHIGANRDLSSLVAFLKKLDIRTVFLSGGLDAGTAGDLGLKPHKSVIELLELCAEQNQYIGVRGALSALVLHKSGFKNVAPIGCPTMYSSDLVGVDEKKINNVSIAIPFHWSIATAIYSSLSDFLLIGQDCIDEEVFLNKSPDASLIKKISEATGAREKEVSALLFSESNSNVYFPKSYEDWFELIGTQGGLLSGRLHAAICGLRQGVPSVLVPWDNRTSELVDYFSLPTTDVETLKSFGATEAFHRADFSKYNAMQPILWSRWKEFLSEVGLLQYVRTEQLPDLTMAKIDSIKVSSSLLVTASNSLSEDSSSSINNLKKLVPRQLKSTIKRLFA
jgi:hypothetical protein